MPIRQPDPDPPSAVSIARATSARREELARDAPDEVEVQRSREATILLTMCIDAVGYEGIQEFLDFIDLRGTAEVRRRLANIAAGCGRRPSRDGR